MPRCPVVCAGAEERAVKLLLAMAVTVSLVARRKERATCAARQAASASRRATDEAFACESESWHRDRKADLDLMPGSAALERRAPKGSARYFRNTRSRNCRLLLGALPIAQPIVTRVSATEGVGDRFRPTNEEGSARPRMQA